MGEIWFWRGLSPFHFVTVPDDECEELRAVSSLVSYGWGVIPVVATVGAMTWSTSLFPGDGAHVVPTRVSVRESGRLALGDRIPVILTLDAAGER